MVPRVLVAVQVATVLHSRCSVVVGTRTMALQSILMKMFRRAGDTSLPPVASLFFSDSFYFSSRCVSEFRPHPSQQPFFSRTWECASFQMSSPSDVVCIVILLAFFPKGFASSSAPGSASRAGNPDAASRFVCHYPHLLCVDRVLQVYLAASLLIQYPLLRLAPMLP